ncbi:hypothetical protein GYMLUDRAFT_35650 [Collybiopsis luxurians FD-317 M1]|nr:hypothetical protein GYMLUDRAFT_35650 [Collybiopsis luxurians FD-317 M1]
MSTRQATPGPSLTRKRPAADTIHGPSDAEGRIFKKVKLDTKKRARRKKKRKSPIVGAGPITPLLKSPSPPKANDQVEKTTTPPPPQESNPPNEIEKLNAELASKSALLQKHQDAVSQIQQNLTCQICLDLLYKPFALSPCGHVACYSCLISWFSRPIEGFGTRQPPVFARKKSCPHCRATIRQPPVEVWPIKNMVNSLVGTGLLIEIPSTDNQAGAETSKDDLWKNIFCPTRSSDDDRDQLGVRDDEDGVYRCIDCHHEINNAICSHCHRIYHGHFLDNPDFSDDGEDLEPYLDFFDEDIADEDEDGFDFPDDFFTYIPQWYHPRRFGRTVDVDDDGSEDDEEAGSLNGFIDDGEGESRIVEVDLDEEGNAEANEPEFIDSRQEPIDVIDVTDDEEDEQPTIRPPSRPRRGAAQVTINLLSDEEEDEEDDEESDEDHHAPRFWSRAAEFDSEDEDEDDEEDDYPRHRVEYDGSDYSDHEDGPDYYGMY